MSQTRNEKPVFHKIMSSHKNKSRTILNCNLCHSVPDYININFILCYFWGAISQFICHFFRLFLFYWLHIWNHLYPPTYTLSDANTVFIVASGRHFVLIQHMITSDSPLIQLTITPIKLNKKF